MPDLIRHSVASRLRCERMLSVQGLRLAGLPAQAGMKEIGNCAERGCPTKKAARSALSISLRTCRSGRKRSRHGLANIRKRKGFGKHVHDLRDRSSRVHAARHNRSSTKCAWREAFGGAMRQLDAIHDRHADIREKKIKTGFLKLFTALLAVCRLMGLRDRRDARPRATKERSASSSSVIRIFAITHCSWASFPAVSNIAGLFSRGKHPALRWVNG